MSLVVIVALSIAVNYKCKYEDVLKARNNTELLFGKARQENYRMRSDIRLLVSNDQKDAAQSKQIYDKWRAEFGLTEKEEFLPPLEDESYLKKSAKPLHDIPHFLGKR